MPDFNLQQYLPEIKNVLSTVCVPALVALIKSELMALNNKTNANGILHYFRLSNQSNKGDHTMSINIEDFVARLEEFAHRTETGVDRLAKAVERLAPLVQTFAPLFGNEGQAVAAGAAIAGKVATAVDAAIPDQNVQ